MKVVLLVVGIVLLLVGVVGALWGFVTASSAETAYNFFCPTGQMPPEACTALLSTASTYRTLAIVAGVIGVGGFALTIAGAVMKETAAPMMMAAPQPVPPPVGGAMRTCPRCGRPNAWSERFCGNCGAPLT